MGVVVVVADNAFAEAVLWCCCRWFRRRCFRCCMQKFLMQLGCGPFAHFLLLYRGVLFEQSASCATLLETKEVLCGLRSDNSNETCTDTYFCCVAVVVVVVVGVCYC